MEQIENMLVLVVDDEPILRMLAIDDLEIDGLPAIEAGNTNEALIQLEAHPEVAVLFTDIQMPPGRDGLELAHVVHEQRPDIHLILTSGRLRPSDEEIPNSGRFLAKPYRAHAVRDILRQMIA